MTLVLLHAFPLDERMWERQLQLLPDAQAPRLYDRGPTMDAWAESLAAEVDDELTLVGSSMGGYCALALGRRVPDRVRGLLLVGARPDADSPERRAGRADTIELLRREGADGLWRSMKPKLFADESRADERLLFRDSELLICAVEAIRDRADSREVARFFGDRLRFVVGEHDTFVSPDELREYDVRVVDGAGHLVNLEAPEAFDAELQAFLADG
ncbi:MAG TPA: alpha/beta hydrolase [Gaiellaceae bacterium]|nr:alpha/beta hydrolase [Gaiellaceae bacterium]